MVNTVLVLGGGSAGFLAALTLKRRLPALEVTVLRSPDIGVIGVGEGTTPSLPGHLHGYLGLDPNPFHRLAEPIWKLGIRFRWGRRPYFDYSFVQALDTRYAGLPRPTGYLVEQDMTDCSPYSALMGRDRPFHRGPDGGPVLSGSFGYHLENATFVRWLERAAAESGIRVVDGTVSGVQTCSAGVAAVTLGDGRPMSADLFVDASGFRSMLMRGALAEPVVSFAPTLWCDRAVIGGWDRRPGEPIHPYTLVETMDGGWAWQIDHERRVNRGYVYSSAFVDDAAAEAEFRRKNPAVVDTRVVRFASGRCERAWVGNVVAIGNAYGFVEPLEATSLGMICAASRNLTELLADGDRHLLDGHRAIFNATTAGMMDATRWFLGLHYRFNTRLGTPFWRACRGEARDNPGVDVTGVQPLIDYYRDVGPSAMFRTALLTPNDPFGVEGYLVLLVGQQVPYRRTYQPADADRAAWDRLRAGFAAAADQGVTMSEALQRLRHPQFGWRRDAFGGGGGAAPATVATATYT
jgi:tryptophan halogenase